MFLFAQVVAIPPASKEAVVGAAKGIIVAVAVVAQMVVAKRVVAARAFVQIGVPFAVVVVIVFHRLLVVAVLVSVVSGIALRIEDLHTKERKPRRALGAIRRATYKGTQHTHP